MKKGTVAVKYIRLISHCYLWFTRLPFVISIEIGFGINYYSVFHTICFVFLS